MKTSLLLAAVALLAVPSRALETVTLDSPSPLVEVKVMVKNAGSAADEAGKEGQAALTAESLIEGGFLSHGKLVTKDDLAELTRSWGSGAYPSASVTKEVTVFSFTVPREVFARYADEVIKPMFGAPQFDAKELERLRGESLQALTSGLRLERIEDFGHVALDNVIHDGTSYAHPDLGTAKGLAALTRADAEGFYKARYGQDSVVVGLSATDKSFAKKLEDALGALPVKSAAAAPAAAPAAVKGRSVVIVSLPNAISTGLHAGYPLPLTRRDADYWPLYVANIWFGTHRDDFSHLYQVLREQRGYNYGDYSYIEHFEGRAENLFPPFNTPRLHQYFSLWARPVGHQYAAHVARALTWELENFIRSGLTEEQCALSKNKAKVLYLSLAETNERMLASRLDDAFYGLATGYLPGYLKTIDAVTCAQVNAAIKTHLHAENLKYLVVTNAAEAPKIAEALLSTGPVWGKGPADYQIDAKDENAQKVYLVPETKLDLLRRDAAWAYEPLGLSKDAVRIVPVETMFETAALPK